jgi:hypothetical protein
LGFCRFGFFVLTRFTFFGAFLFCVLAKFCPLARVWAVADAPKHKAMARSRAGMVLTNVVLHRNGRSTSL